MTATHNKFEMQVTAPNSFFLTDASDTGAANTVEVVELRKMQSSLAEQVTELATKVDHLARVQHDETHCRRWLVDHVQALEVQICELAVKMEPGINEKRVTALENNVNCFLRQAECFGRVQAELIDLREAVNQSQERVTGDLRRFLGTDITNLDAKLQTVAGETTERQWNLDCQLTSLGDTVQALKTRLTCEAAAAEEKQRTVACLLKRLGGEVANLTKRVESGAEATSAALERLENTHKAQLASQNTLNNVKKKLDHLALKNELAEVQERIIFWKHRLAMAQGLRSTTT